MNYFKFIGVERKSITDYPGGFTSTENSIILKNIHDNSFIIHLFSGRSTIGDIRIDLNTSEATINADIFEVIDCFSDYIKELVNKNRINKNIVVLMDFPYNEHFTDVYDSLNTQNINTQDKQFIGFSDVRRTNKLFDFIGTVISPDLIIMKSWHVYEFKKYGYKFKSDIDNPDPNDTNHKECYTCYPGGYRMSTFLLFIEKINNKIKENGGLF